MKASERLQVREERWRLTEHQASCRESGRQQPGRSSGDNLLLLSVLNDHTPRSPGPILWYPPPVPLPK